MGAAGETKELARGSLLVATNKVVVERERRELTKLIRTRRECSGKGAPYIDNKLDMALLINREIRM
jgi:hypothetical protein